MPERDDIEAQLRQELLRQTPPFELGASLPSRVSALVRRRHRVRVGLVIGAAAVVVAAVAVPLSSLRSAPLGRKITPATTPTTPTTSTTPSTPTSTTTPPTLALAPFACASLDLWTTPTGTPVSSTVTLGLVSATLTGTRVTSPGDDPALSNPVLGVSQSVLSGPAVTQPFPSGFGFRMAVTPPAQADAVIPWSIAPAPPQGTTSPPNSDALCLAYFPGFSLPTVLVGLDTGGAHCCTVVRTITLSTTGHGPVVDDDVGNPAASLAADGHSAVIVTADNAFAYAFGSFGASGLPVKVLQLGAGAFTDVTRQHLDLVTKDAAVWWTTFNADPGNGLSVLAPWVADECVVGQATSAWSTVGQLLAQGKLTGPVGWPTGAAYVSALKAFLAQHGYCPA